jgi:hypothetical protein
MLARSQGQQQDPNEEEANEREEKRKANEMEEQHQYCIGVQPLFGSIAIVVRSTIVV